MKKSFSEIFTSEVVFKFAMYIFFLIVPLILLFVWQETFTINKTIAHEKFGTFGDFFGGVFGSIWALCGVILFYSALREQRKDFDNNKIALSKQIEALEIQTQEFKLQRDELKESRMVFVEQSKTLKQQRFESTFFSLIDLYNKIILNLDMQDENKNYFKKLKQDLYNRFIHKDNIIECHEIALKNYVKLFYIYKEELTHYYRTIYRILSIIDNSELKEDEKITYVKILRSQLSENELLFLFYNAETTYGKKLYPLILKYNLLKHLPILSKLEFQYYTFPRDNKNDFHQFNTYIFELLSNFINNLHKKINDDSFTEELVSIKSEFDEQIIISFSSQELNYINIKFILLNNEITKILEYDMTLFQDYFKRLLFDFLAFSRYNEPSKFTINSNITSETNQSILEFAIDSELNIKLNKDTWRSV